MSKTPQYHIFLQQPNQIMETEVEVFHDWVNQYPYVPIFRVLLAAKYMLEDHPETSIYIEQAAFFVQDRKHLKHLLRKYKSLTEKPAKEKEILIDNSHLDEGKIKIHNESLSENEEKELQEIIQSGTIVKEIEENQSDSIELTSIHDDSNEPIIHEIDIQTPTENTSEIEEVIEQVTIEPTIVLPHIEEQNLGIADSDIQEEKISEQDDIDFLNSLHISTPPQPEAISLEEWILEKPGHHIPEISENAIIDNCLSSTDIQWLMPWIEDFFPKDETIINQPNQVQNIDIALSDKIKKEENNLSSTTETKNLNTESIKDSSSSNRSFDEWLQILEMQKNKSADSPIFDLPSPEIFPETDTSNSSKINTSFSQLDQEKQTQIPSDSSNVKQLADDSISFKRDMATETLAKLYERQGKIQLAIMIYQQLIDKYPEKSSFFARQINRLKQ
ncbi:MAG: hypothetical protein LC105_13255 [Chitinophagales bacterium]|nr:hypothetical protein [Chitinophagales bacterium]MCZ2394824.1 hypothetical protein [Chitinophagales bacterium]